MLKNIDKITLVFFLGGILCLSSFLVWTGYHQRALSFSSAPQHSFQSSPHNSQPDSIQISKLKLNLAIEGAEIINGVWQTNPNGVSHLSSSANPGSKGNIIIYGHNKKELFGKIKNLTLGDEVTITTTDNQSHHYKIYQVLTVSPNQVNVLTSVDEEILTLYTCTGFADSQRLVIKAKPVFRERVPLHLS